MFKIILRAILDIMVFTILIPIKLLVILWAVGYAIYCKIDGSLTFTESFTALKEGIKIAFDKELLWIKTGKVEEL